MQTGSSKTLIGWKSGKTTYVPPWDRMGGASFAVCSAVLSALLFILLSLSSQLLTLLSIFPFYGTWLLVSILVSYSIQGIDFPPRARLKIPILQMRSEGEASN
jgi:hypothetical protein